jgi:regulator of protease activity HflC (stomatin/prohibitin superfamily)
MIDRIAYRHSLKEVPMDVAPQVCITRDNTQVQIDGILYYQVTDAKLASYGNENYTMAIESLAKTCLRSEVGRRELDKLLEERQTINVAVVSALDEASITWGVKTLRYEIKDITPPHDVLASMQLQMTAEREKRAIIAKAEGAKQAAIANSEGEKQAAINAATGEAEASTTASEEGAVAEAEVTTEATTGTASVEVLAARFTVFLASATTGTEATGVATGVATAAATGVAEAEVEGASLFLATRLGAGAVLEAFIILGVVVFVEDIFTQQIILAN